MGTKEDKLFCNPCYVRCISTNRRIGQTGRVVIVYYVGIVVYVSSGQFTVVFKTLNNPDLHD